MHTFMRASSRSKRTRGFTLAEILIALALIAVLAAVLLPTVAGQILKGDAGRVMQDVEAVRAGVDQFLADVHRYPRYYSQLSKPIVVADSDINANTYTTGLVGRWSGPYVTKDTLGAVVLTGFGGSIQNKLMKVANTNGVDYVTVVILGIAYPDFQRINEQIDGTSGVDSLSGLLRYSKTGGIDSVKFLATPIQ